MGGGVTRASAMTSDCRLLHKGQSLIPPRTTQILTSLNKFGKLKFLKLDVDKVRRLKVDPNFNIMFRKCF